MFTENGSLGLLKTCSMINNNFVDFTEKIEYPISKSHKINRNRPSL